MMRTRTIRIKQAGNRCYIEPSVIVLAPGDKVKVINLTKQTIYMHILGTNTVIVIPQQSSITWVVPRLRTGAYPYVAFCYELASFCLTTGLPIIIVPKRGDAPFDR